MTQDNLLNVLNFITTVDCPDEQKKALLEMAANTITLDKLWQLVWTAKEQNTKDKASNENAVGIVNFTKQEISQMPKSFRKEFRTAGCTAHVLRRRSGKNNWNYMIRYRKNGYNIVATSNNLEEAKRKFIKKLSQADELKKQQAIAEVTETPLHPTALLKKSIFTEVNGIPATFDKFANYYFEKFHKRKVCEESYRITLSNYKNHVLPHFGDIQAFWIS